MEKVRRPDTHEQEVARLIESLKDVYSSYAQADTEEPKSRQRITRLFKKWFSGFDPLTTQPVNEAFLSEVQRIVAKMAAVLENMKNKTPDASEAIAAKALDIMLAPKPRREKTTTDWYLSISEYLCAPLLPYASSDKLMSARTDMLKRTPKRMMLPKQRELLNTIEETIKKTNRKEM